MRTIGKYEVVEKIGEGGFGTIFKGFDPHIRRFVAIKSCTSEEEEVRSRFLHEAQIAGNLQHRHIVTVYDFGLQDGVPYLVQEYLSGEDLDRKIKRQEFIPLAEKLLYLIQVARGLEYAHSRGVVHRDVKPANIRILEDGTAKIMDFGIAKLADQETGLTATGMTIGTAAYLAPEQIRGEPIDRRTDIFSWGVTAWELLAYRRPFTGQHISTVLYQILHVPAPRLRPAVADCPEELEAIVRRCLEKEPARRYEDCGELLRDIDAALKARRLTSSEIPLGMAARQAAEMAETRSLGAPAPPRRAAGARNAPPAPTDASGELVDLDLDSTAQSRRTPRSISTTQAARTRGFAWGRWVAAVLALVATAGVAALLLGGRNAGSAAPPRDADGGERSPPAASIGVAGAERQEAGEGQEAGGPGEGGDALAATAGAGAPATDPLLAPSAGPAAATSATAAATPEVTAAPPPPPPPPQPAYVLVPAAWSPEVTVSVRGQRRRSLGEAQRIAVTPGRSVTLVFEYRGDDYSASESRTVTVHEGATVDVENPLPAPGQVQVQQKLGTPPGRVSLDGEALGVGRVRRTLAPGPHRLRIEPSSAGGGGAIDREVTVPSGRRLVLTFDLTRGALVEVVAPLD